MEEIYTVHVKCRPDPTQNYPSERAYSSSTVGGLAITHVIIALFVTTLTTAGYCNRSTWIGEFISGVSLISGALLCALTGILASKRWYIDRNIRWFFTASIISTICSATSLSLLMFFLVKPTLNRSFVMLFLNDNKLNQTNELLTIVNNTNYTENFDRDIEIMKDASGFGLNEPLRRYTRETDSEEITFQLEIYIHLLIASLVELILSFFSIKIGWKGVRNSCRNNFNSTGTISSTGKPIRPDILENHKNGYCDPKLSHYSNVVKELYRLQKSSMISDNFIDNRMVSKIANESQNKLSLPLPESQKEYRERIEKFLASNDKCIKE